MQRGNNFYRTYGKRILDFGLSCFGIIFLLPVFIIVAILIRIKLGSPVLFKQERPGKDEELFVIYKFRTMNSDKDAHGNLLPDNVRLTKFGAFLRSSSLDELPELYNILKGDMSFVGPRPLSILYLPYYNEFEKERHSVRPGLTGLAQINGRNSVNWEERFLYDVNYVHNITFRMDVILILTTFQKVLSQDGVKVRGTTTIEDFHTYRVKQSFSYNENQAHRRSMV